ncbi:MAG: hypothetical protein C3F08_08295 [Candidatus Methylomirabilota bacterium]|nr:MAG: hypothetical protein C3F08_08295 [candidate division NC10 bacterium]
MMNRRGAGIIVLAGSLVVVHVQAAWAQVALERLVGMKQAAERVRASAQRLPESRRQMLSSGTLNLINLAERWDQIEPRLRRVLSLPSGMDQPIRQTDAGETPADRMLAAAQVSNPAVDVSSSRRGGFTQSETSTAWCGSNVVVGFNDTGSLLETLSLPGIGASLVGISRSTNKGGRFTDQGYLNPGPVATDFLVGDPVVGCGDANTFYATSIFGRATTSDISISQSFDGGQTFGNPISAASKDGVNHFLDKPWMAVDPTNPNRIYVTYTDFDDSGDLCGFDSASGLPIPRTAIELVRSTDRGGSWNSPPVVIREVCGDAFVHGSQVAVGPGGELYVAWEAFAEDFVTREIDIRKSIDGGVTFGAPVQVDNVICAGTCARLQGNFRSGYEFPTLAVDRSGGSTNGNIYIAWHDGRNLTVPDAVVGSYGYTDILFSRSTDGGATWLTPVRVNNNAEPLSSGLGTDQYQPGIAVDKGGKVGVCFYDRRRDPSNFLIDRECAFSRNAGASWSNKKITRNNFPAVPNQDVFVDPLYMGDYDNLAGDFTRTSGGFVGAWGDNSLGHPVVNAGKF